MNKCPLYGQMENRGLKSTTGQQSSGQYSLTSHKRYTKPNHPLQEKIRLISICLQFCFIPGEQMSTLWANGNRGLKSTTGQQSSRQYSLTSHKKFTTSPTILFKKKFANSAFFHNFASFQVNKCPLYGQMETWGLKSTSGNKAANSTL